jgi:hypothetical protein
LRQSIAAKQQTKFICFYAYKDKQKVIYNMAHNYDVTKTSQGIHNSNKGLNKTSLRFKGSSQADSFKKAETELSSWQKIKLKVRSWRQKVFKRQKTAVLDSNPVQTTEKRFIRKAILAATAAVVTATGAFLAVKNPKNAPISETNPLATSTQPKKGELPILRPGVDFDIRLSHGQHQGYTAFEFRDGLPVLQVLGGGENYTQSNKIFEKKFGSFATSSTVSPGGFRIGADAEGKIVLHTAAHTTQDRFGRLAEGIFHLTAPSAQVTEAQQNLIRAFLFSDDPENLFWNKFPENLNTSNPAKQLNITQDKLEEIFRESVPSTVNENPIYQSAKPFPLEQFNKDFSLPVTSENKAALLKTLESPGHLEGVLKNGVLEFAGKTIRFVLHK